MKIYLQIIQLVVGGLAVGGFLYIINKAFVNYQRKQDRKRDLKHVIESFKNSEKIYDDTVTISQDVRATYGHILLFHNGGRKMNELTEKRLTIRTEFTASKEIAPLKNLWNNREVDGAWLKIINPILENKYIHIKNMREHTPQQKTGIRKLYNSRRGNEVFIRKIDWVGDTLVLFAIQFEPSENVLNERQLGQLLGKTSHFADLFCNAKYFIEK